MADQRGGSVSRIGPDEHAWLDSFDEPLIDPPALHARSQLRPTQRTATQAHANHGRSLLGSLASL